MTQRRGVHSSGSPTRAPEPTKGANPDGRTPVELPTDPAAVQVDASARKAKQKTSTPGRSN